VNDIATSGVAERMLEAAGFEVLERGWLISTMECPMPSSPGVRRPDTDPPRRRCASAIMQRSAATSSRPSTAVVTTDHQFVIAHPPQGENRR
jgi:hypothetical protein